MKNLVQYPGLFSIGLLLASLLVAGSEWGTLAELERWSDLTTPTNFFSFMKSLGPVLVVWLSKAPVK